MSRNVFCRRFQKDLEGLEKPPFPGPLGQDVFEHVSKQAWLDWLEHQTRIINEQHLNMMDMTSRKYLQEQMKKFFAGEEVDQAQGYTEADKD
ncbi:MAG: oxidative damage protection protein [Gammaproteobacteria bacterium]|nr:oxidative damage protection protein [Gammaproteobacteria bacterium]